MHRHPVAAAWGRTDLASADMMSLETSRRVWQARIDPRRQTPAVGIYTHVRDRWGIFYAQPIVLNERQAGAAIEGVVRQETIETAQLAVDTHGYTDFAMALARLLGFDLCPRLRELRQRRLFVPRAMEISAEIAAVCEASVDTTPIETHWDDLVRLAASVMSGHTGAVAALARFGAAARGDPVYEAGVQLGKLLRTVFLADYFVNAAFRRELLRVLNRGEAVNALKRSIYTWRVGPAQARRADEMQAVADALSLLANIVMAWNTAQMQSVLDRWTNRRQVVPPELIGRIAPTRLEGINLRGVFRFSRSSATPIGCCCRKPHRKQVPPHEIDGANTPSAAYPGANRNIKRNRYLPNLPRATAGNSNRHLLHRNQRDPYLWSYASTAFDALKGVVFDLAETRGAEHPKKFLRAWRGTLVCDDYVGYKALFGADIVEAGCMAHARRKFHELHAAGKSSLADQALRLFGQLYEVEREVKDRDPDERRRIRQSKARPIADDLHA